MLFIENVHRAEESSSTEHSAWVGGGGAGAQIVYIFLMYKYIHIYIYIERESLNTLSIGVLTHPLD